MPRLSLTERFAYKETTATSSTTKTTGSSQTKRFNPYRHPSEQKYLHLNPLPDLLKLGLELVFVGFNPGVKSSEVGHRFAHRSNCFWKLLNECGLIEKLGGSEGQITKKLTFEDDVNMPDEYSIGFTELVARPTKSIDEIPFSEMKRNVPILISTLNKHKPKVVCFVGKGIWNSVASVTEGGTRDFKWGEQKQKWFDGRVVVVPSTSGLVRLKYEEKLEVWKTLCDVVTNK